MLGEGAADAEVSMDRVREGGGEGGAGGRERAGRERGREGEIETNQKEGKEGGYV